MEAPFYLIFLIPGSSHDNLVAGFPVEDFLSCKRLLEKGLGFIAIKVIALVEERLPSPDFEPGLPALPGDNRNGHPIDFMELAQLKERPAPAKDGRC